jgi:hypothetical protein
MQEVAVRAIIIMGLLRLVVEVVQLLVLIILPVLLELQILVVVLVAVFYKVAPRRLQQVQVDQVFVLLGIRFKEE